MQRLQQTRQVLGSAGIITLVFADDYPAVALFDALWRQIEGFEERFSRFLPASELTRFNHAAGKRVAISQAFHNLLTASKNMSEQTDGLYNPFTLPALQRAGYKGSWPTPDEVDARITYTQRHVVPPDRLEIWADGARIPHDTAIDSGGIGKGYLLDQLAAFLDGRGVFGYWLALGGDIICSGMDVTGEPWRVGIQHALHEDEVIASVSNQRGRRLAIATSGVTKRRGRAHGKQWHHIIDPRTDRPAVTDMRTATVCMDNATAADVYATCLVITGSMAAPALVRAKHIDRAILQFSASGSAEDFQIEEIGATS